MSLFQHGRFLNTLFSALDMFFFLEGSSYGITGIRIRAAGKISVTGNARKRSLLFTRGRTTASASDSKVSYGFYLIRTTTGCVGLSV